jgi:hypothetical protein
MYAVCRFCERRHVSAIIQHVCEKVTEDNALQQLASSAGNSCGIPNGKLLKNPHQKGAILSRTAN